MSRCKTKMPESGTDYGLTRAVNSNFQRKDTLNFAGISFNFSHCMQYIKTGYFPYSFFSKKNNAFYLKNYFENNFFLNRISV